MRGERERERARGRELLDQFTRDHASALFFFLSLSPVHRVQLEGTAPIWHHGSTRRKKKERERGRVERIAYVVGFVLPFAASLSPPPPPSLSHTMSDSDDRIHLQVTYSGRTLSLALEPSARLSRLVSVLEQEFSVATSTAKLVAKGKKLDLSLSANDDPDETTIEHFLELNRLVATTTTTTRPVKMLLIGPRSDALDALRDAEHVRDKKRLAFRHHASLAKLAKPTSTAVFVSTTTSDHYGFSKLEPFPETTVACFEMRSRMLERLSTDPAVLDIMKRHKFSVGVL